VLDFWNNDSDPICLSIHYALIRSLMRAGWSQRGGRKPQPVAKCRGWGSLWKPYLSRDIVPLPPFNLIVVFQHSSIKKERAPLSARGKRPSSIDFVEQKDPRLRYMATFCCCSYSKQCVQCRHRGYISPPSEKRIPMLGSDIRKEHEDIGAQWK